MAKTFKENEGASGVTDVSWVEDEKHIDPQYACSSICVTGFPVETRPEKLIEHFQHKNNGGGRIIVVIWCCHVRRCMRVSHVMLQNAL